MRPIAIFRHSRTEGPGYFAIFLERHGIPWQLIAIDEGEPIPPTPDAFSGLCFMGGPMSVNDHLPWLDPACALIRAAVDKDIPVIGHCLGGQLMSKALGGYVTRNPVKEMGWGDTWATAGGATKRWLGDLAGENIPAFHWHGETFSLPLDSARLLESAWCANQAFVYGPHLGLQCHVEMLPEMIQSWCKGWHEEIEGLAEVPPAVQAPEAMLAEMEAKLPAMRRLADQLYSVWIKGLKAD